MHRPASRLLGSGRGGGLAGFGGFLYRWILCYSAARRIQPSTESVGEEIPMTSPSPWKRHVGTVLLTTFLILGAAGGTVSAQGGGEVCLTLCVYVVDFKIGCLELCISGG